MGRGDRIQSARRAWKSGTARTSFMQRTARARNEDRSYSGRRTSRYALQDMRNRVGGKRSGESDERSVLGDTQPRARFTVRA
ncbi:hypothetical protein EXIGLDRAFT_100841 [Exidia glandulosa HHB12029]|uniref:Uncharacterized protein n=1 Tax=Exidia glandulosa HHB12029 TaxID=1314781 RepID=A0A165NS17_EXIGL|nr:hypothetical protein EXIGLDRAFT_100841 [Exidia glandulosa HHB12029]